LDRIDIHVEVPLVTGESSAVIRERVAAARDIQVQRFKAAKITTNAAATSGTPWSP
jgi:predicted ATPase with chaperone activity